MLFFEKYYFGRVEVRLASQQALISIFLEAQQH